MKIKKNLSDEEMFKGYVEKESFENAFDADEKIVSSKMKNKAAAAKELLLPAEAQEKLNQYLLEISMVGLKMVRVTLSGKFIRNRTNHN